MAHETDIATRGVRGPELDFRRDPRVLAPLVEVLGEAVFTADRDLRVVAWSAGLGEITGVAPLDARGRFVEDLDRGGCAGFAQVRQLRAREAGAVLELEVRCGTEGRPLAGRALALADDHGRFAGVICSLHPRPTAREIGPGTADPTPDADSALHSLAGLVGRSPAIQDAFRRIRLAAQSPVVTSIRGESGTGKELAARAIHELGPRRNRRFVAVNCSALSESLLESELFGHTKGAFTGAIRDRAGLFQEADGGTLLLDEVGEIGPSTQVKLLRVLQERTVRPVGSDHDVPVDVRLLTATNRDLRELVSDGRMRPDFFYRIGVYEIPMPPLRERLEDVPLLVEFFRRQLAEEQERAVPAVSPAAMRRMLEYPWPGNVRELRNAIEHAFVTVQDGRVEVYDLPESVRIGVAGAGFPEGARTGAAAASSTAGSLSPREEAERRRILEALDACEWHRGRTAEALGMSRVTLWKKIRRYRIDEGVFRRG